MKRRRGSTGASTTKNYNSTAYMKNLLAALMILGLVSCVDQPTNSSARSLNAIATDYVKLSLAIGQYDSDFVDAYYGPDSLKPSGIVSGRFPLDSLLKEVAKLQDEIKPFTGEEQPDSIKGRAVWMNGQLASCAQRIRIFGGQTGSFEEECRNLFGVTPPVYTESYFKGQVGKLDSLLPGKGSIAERFQQLAHRFVIPKDKIDTVFKTSISVSRKRTMEHISLPASEQFSLEYVQDKPWSGYNWYKGNFTSLIQINTDTDIFIERAIDVASHESYPGHHVYNMLLEKNLYKGKGHLEISLYPLFSPQSLIAEGSANYGIELAFPGDEKIRFAADVLLPLAGVDTTGISLYFRALALKGELNFVRNEVARGLLNKAMDEQEGLRWLIEYGLNNKETAEKSIRFIKKYRAYVINYNYGLRLVRNYIEAGEQGKADMPVRWKRFEQLLSSPVTPAMLQKASP